MGKNTIFFGILSFLLTSSAGAFGSAEGLSCASLFESQNRILKSSIGHSYSENNSVSVESVVATSVSPYLIPTENISVTQSKHLRGNTWARSLYSICKLCLGGKKNKLSVVQSKETQRLEVYGALGPGQTREVRMQTQAFSLKYPSRDFSQYSGVQMSLDFKGSSQLESQTSLVIHARKLKSVGATEYNYFSFKAKIPKAVDYSVSKNGNAPSYMIDFDQMKIESDFNYSFADAITEVEITGFGLEFESKDATDLPVEVAVIGDLNFVSDLAKLIARHDDYLKGLSHKELVAEFLKETAYLSSPELVRIVELIRSKNESAFHLTPKEVTELSYSGNRYILEQFFISNISLLSNLSEQELISFFHDRPTLVTGRAPRGRREMLGSTFWTPPSHYLRTIVSRLYDTSRQRNTIRVLNENGLDYIIQTLEAAGFHQKQLEVVSFLTLWQKIAPYNQDTYGHFGIVTDLGSFGLDHGEPSHLLQLYTIIEGMSDLELNEFKSIFRQMQSSQTAFTYLWTLIFEAPGSATANSPRYWRDLVRNSREPNRQSL